MKWNTKDQRRHEVVSSSGWKDLKNYKTLKPVSGVYIFADVNLHVRYVGKAGAGRMVKEIDSALRRGKGRGATRVKALYTNSDKRAKSLERYLIGKYNPPNNWR